MSFIPLNKRHKILYVFFEIEEVQLDTLIHITFLQQQEIQLIDFFASALRLYSLALAAGSS